MRRKIDSAIRKRVLVGALRPDPHLLLTEVNRSLRIQGIVKKEWRFIGVDMQ